MFSVKSRFQTLHEEKANYVKIPFVCGLLSDYKYHTHSGGQYSVLADDCSLVNFKHYTSLRKSSLTIFPIIINTVKSITNGNEVTRTITSEGRPFSIIMRKVTQKLLSLQNVYFDLEEDFIREEDFEAEEEEEKGNVQRMKIISIRSIKMLIRQVMMTMMMQSLYSSITAWIIFVIQYHVSEKIVSRITQKLTILEEIEYYIRPICNIQCSIMSWMQYHLAFDHRIKAN